MDDKDEKQRGAAEDVDGGATLAGIMDEMAAEVEGFCARAEELIARYRDA